MKLYTPPKKYRTRWIKLIDESIGIWADRANGMVNWTECPLCTLEYELRTGEAKGYKCECPLCQVNKNGLHPCCKGLWSEWHLSGHDATVAKKVLAYIKAQRKRIAGSK